MANVKNFGLIGVGSDLQFGKAGTRLVNNAGVFNFKAANGSTDVALTAAGITSSAGNVTLTTGNVVLSDNAGTVGIGGATLSRQAASILKFDGTAAFMAPVGNTAARPGTAASGMIRVNSDTPSASTVEFYNGTTWMSLATGGDATALQTEVNAIESTLGTLVNTDGTTNVATALSNSLFGGATNLTTALQNLATGVQGKDTLDEIFPSATIGNIIYANGSNLWAMAAPGATSGVQAYDAGLAALAAKTTTGLLVQTGNDTFESRSLVAPARGFSITDASGVAGAPTFVLANNLSALEANTTPGYYVITADGTSTSRTFAGTAGNIVVTNGSGVASNTDIDLATVSQAASGNFVKVTLDGFGRVTGNTAVTTADITALVNATYVNVSGDTMSGALDMGTFKITGLGDPTLSQDAATKNYVDNAVTGLSWKQSVHTMSSTDVTLATPGASIGGLTMALGERILLTGQATGSENGIYVFDTASTPLVRSSDANVYGELNGASVFVEQGTYADTGWVQTATLTSFSSQAWVQFSGAGAYTGGTGVDITGNVISVNLGAGIAQLPSDEVGIDLFNASTGALILTPDGTARGTATGDKLHLLLDGAGALAQTASGLKINAASVTNAMLVNNYVTLNADSGTQNSLTLGDTLLIAGTAGQGIFTAVTADTITITAADATTLAKGVASFNSTSFSVSSGAVSLNTVDTAHGGTGLTAFVANEVFYAGTTSTVNQSTNFRFDGTSTLTMGGALPLTINGATGAITATATNSDLVLMPNGTGSVIVGPVGAGLMQSDAGQALTIRGNTTLTLVSLTNSMVLTLASGTTKKVSISGPTAADYATGLAANDLTNKQYVDDAIASGATAGSIAARKITVPLNANGTTSIGAALPAGATVLSVKVNVTVVDASATLSVGVSGNVARYMTTAENDAQTTGLYLAETYDTDGSAVTVIATVAGSTGSGSGSCQVIVQYQNA